MSDSVRSHRWQPTRFRCPWDSPVSEGDCEPRAWQRGTCWPWRGLWLQVQVPPGHWRAWAGQDSRLNRSSLAAVWRMYWGYQKHKPGDLLGWGLCSNQVTDASGSGHGVAVDTHPITSRSHLLLWTHTATQTQWRATASISHPCDFCVTRPPREQYVPDTSCTDSEQSRKRI